MTNLETNERKLLQIILIGQPELREMLARPELEQLAQRVIARFHLQALSEAETAHYVRHRLAVAGHSGALPFDAAALRQIHRRTGGVPRRINLLCDRALLGAYSQGRRQVDAAILGQAAGEVFEPARPPRPPAARYRRWTAATLGLAGAAAVAAVLALVARPPEGGTAGPMASGGARPASVSLAVSAALPQDPGDAWQELARLWKIELPLGGDPCTLLKGQPVQCFNSDDGLALLRLLGRPSILMLRDAEGQVLPALLLGLDDRQITLRIKGRARTLSLLELGRQWRGEFTTLWQVPPGYEGRITAGPALDWLDRHLALALGEAAAGTDSYDAALQARVAAFQRVQGLKSDGRAGPITLMQLNRAAGLAEPSLGAAEALSAKP